MCLRAIEAELLLHIVYHGLRLRDKDLRDEDIPSIEVDNYPCSEEVRAALAKGEQVKLSGFGNFDLRDKNRRPGRNPKTGEEIPISARRVVTFRPGQKLKARVEAYAGTPEQ